MAKNILVISCDIRETRAALIENGIIAELHIERKGRQSSTVGNVYLGKVTRVLPGLQAAFIDIGQERAAFLHVEDLIRPDDFDEYLAGGRKLARARAETGEIVEDDEGEDPAPPAAAVEAADAEAESIPPRVPTKRPGSDDLETTVAYPDWPLPPNARTEARSEASGPSPNGSSSLRDALLADEDAALVGEPSESQPAPLPPPSSGALVSHAEIASSGRLGSAATPVTSEAEVALREDAEDSLEGEPDFASTPSLDEPPEDEEDLASEPPESLVEGDASEGPVATGETSEDDDDLLDAGDLPGFTISDPGEPVPRAPAPSRNAERGGRRRRRRGRGDRPGEADTRSRGGERGERAARGDHRGGGRDGGRERDRRGGRPAQPLPGRISKSTPIREVVKEGQEIIVQISKDPIGTKGARCTSHISLPGRYVVYLPTVEHVGISKRIGSDKERARLRETIEQMKPPSGGLIVRTVAEGLTKKQLKQDVGYLVRLWGEIAKKREGAKSPYLLSSELDLVLKVARDLFTDEVDEVVIDDRGQYDRLCRFVEMFAPDRVKDVKLYDEEDPIFDEYGIEDEIGRALARKVPLPSGGYLIIDQAEALTAIDVNTGRFVGKGSKDMEETILKTNMEAVHEIAYQLRFRNIGGLIILDLIDMEQHKNREKVRRTLEELLQKDKAKTTLNRISDLGLIEMTRKRTRESLGRLLHEPCFYCDGTGQLQSKETIAYEILREIRRKKSSLPGYSVVVNAHPAVADVLNGTERAALQEAENRFMRKIIVVPRKEYHLEQFDLQGK